MKTESKSKLIAATLTGAMVISMAVAVYYHSADSKHKEELKKELLVNDSLQAVKQNLDKEIASFRNKLAEMEGMNNAISDKLKAAEKIMADNEALITKLKKENSGVKGLKKQIKTLTDTKAQLQNLYDALLAENKQLKADNENYKRQVATLSNEKMSLDAQYAALAKATMSFSSDNFRVEVTKTDTDKLTTKAKRVKHLSISFTLPYNPVFGNEVKTVYVSIIDSKGASVISDKDKKVKVDADGKTTDIISIASKNVDFSKCPQQINMEINVIEKLKQDGVYKIQVYTENGIIGTSEFKLN